MNQLFGIILKLVLWAAFLVMLVVVAVFGWFLIEDTIAKNSEVGRGVNAICSQIESGMTIQEVVQVRRQAIEEHRLYLSGGPDMTFIGPSQSQSVDEVMLRVEIAASNNALCICQVPTKNRVTTAKGKMGCPS